jgi:SAM-dependent methyltransferase
VVVGLDPSLDMVRSARARGLEVVEASASSIPLPDASFDVVFSNAALHWVDDHPSVIREVARVLRPGGRMVARLGGAGNQSEVIVAGIALFGQEPYVAHRPHDLRAPWNMGDPGEWAVELVRHEMRILDLRLIPSPTGWRNVDDMKQWFIPIANVFTRFLPAELRERYFHDLIDLAWQRIDPDRAFIRLVVDAER